ncbi:serine/threonine protein kinase [Epidermidibacterium keratini]|uniref:non-specific serine/threonine protein kinase n=1 Tax=Epidermidibacterium keratini TaxID=1891644 RepID=A0A7L4YHZ3_9ACTN|nr:RIO1 family regulatory kinase/ATPase [Epidermidibacterium keratini]QHB99055.1 serine/threonine protein kinase [Epidermidibacterium keratini]
MFNKVWSESEGAWVALPDDQRHASYPDLEKGQRGPTPIPSWLPVGDGMIDTEFGMLKTGKEADVHLIERSEGTRSCLLAAKRYRTTEHRDFRRSAVYTAGRVERRSRDQRAIEKKTGYGRSVAAGQWAGAEWGMLRELWNAGAPVPYPVQIDGTEILMEYVADPDDPLAAAPRLHAVRADRRTAELLWEQVREAMHLLARMGYAHGDLSPYNMLVAGERLVVIDLPQVVDIVANPFGADLLQRDCVNVCTWFAARGVDADPDGLFGELLASAY